MNQTLTETVGRYLDGDLSEQEAEDVRLRLESDAEWKREFDAVTQLRDSVLALARRENPPSALDDLVLPLRRDGRPRPRGFSLLPLVAAAATILLWVVVGTTVGKRVWIRDSSGPSSPFVLQPLPSAAGVVPLGALERLMAWSIPEPDLNLPEALQILGPLPDPPPPAYRHRALQVGSTRLPLEGSSAQVGATVILSVRAGIVSGCSSREGDTSAREVCATVLDVTVQGLDDGEYRAEVVPAT